MDIAYVDIEFTEDTPSPYFSSISSRTESWIVSAAGFYRLFEEAGAFLDLTAGIRYWNVDSTLSLQGGALPAQKISNREEWLDPKIGLKGLYPFASSKFYFSGGVSMGGFGAGSDVMWDLSANLGYRWTETFSTIFGYRYLDVDYEKDGFLYDVAQKGPVLGLSWRF